METNITIYAIGGEFSEKLVARCYDPKATLLVVKALMTRTEAIGVSLHGYLKGKEVSGEFSLQGVIDLCS